MLRTLCLVGVIILSLAHHGGARVASSQSGGVVLELTQIENRLVKAWLDGDRNTVDSILAVDWSVIDLTGHVLTKAQVMQELGSGDRKIESGSVDDLTIRVFGGTAVVTGRSVLAGSYQGKRASVTQRFTDVFVSRDGRWQAVASQGTQIAQSTNQ
jgi:ketosteroid isomerase-like protein